MNIVADTNIFLAVALNEPEKAHLIEITAGCRIHAPEILPYEIGNALSAMVKRQKIQIADVQEIYVITQRVPVTLTQINIKEALEIATQENIYAYDAYFLQCAISLSCA
ncbi:MAG: type II toxin-antitoxin system VapC family toxin, partial [Thermosynechococcaceae cyanobacterium]